MLKPSEYQSLEMVDLSTPMFKMSLWQLGIWSRNNVVR